MLRFHSDLNKLVLIIYSNIYWFFFNNMYNKDYTKKIRKEKFDGKNFKMIMEK